MALHRSIDRFYNIWNAWEANQHTEYGLAEAVERRIRQDKRDAIETLRLLATRASELADEIASDHRAGLVREIGLRNRERVLRELETAEPSTERAPEGGE